MRSGLTAADVNFLQQKVDALSKSIIAPTAGLEAAGRTGINALVIDSVDSVLRSIAIEREDFKMTRDIPTIDMKDLTYHYRVKTAVSSQGFVDLWGTQTFLPQEDFAQYQRVAEVAKISGQKISMSTIAQMTNDNGVYALDLEQENEKTATLNLGQNLERALYIGGDFFMDASGAIDYNIATTNSFLIREMRGVQANIREGNRSSRGIPGDFQNYGNNRSVVFNRKGLVIERGFLDKVATAILDNGGAIAEAHCTTSQLSEFRATFFPIERAQLNDSYAIRGPAVSNDSERGFSVDTVAGPVTFVPSRFKYMQQTPGTANSTSGAAPATPAVSIGYTSSAANTGWTAGQTFYYRVQAVSISGRSQASASALATIPTSNFGVELTITNANDVEYYMVFRTDVTTATAGKEMFVGRIAKSQGGSTIFRDVGRLVPGLSSMLFLPRDKKRAKLGKMGNLVNKLELGRQGLATETVYFSVTACIVDAPRACALVDNVFEARTTLDYDDAE